MGCWNGTCGLTNMPIYHGDRAVVIPIAQRSEYLGLACYCHDFCVISGFAIRGAYDDYGALEKIDDTLGAQKTVELFAKALNREVTLTIPDHYKEYKNEIKDAKNLINLIERGFMTCKTPSWHKSPIRDMIVSFMMFHEEAFDKIITETGGRKGYKTEATFAEYLRKGFEKRREEMEKYKKKGLSFLRPHDSISRWLESETFLLGKFALKSIPKNMETPLIELYLFETAMGLLRKHIMPQPGAGSQCGEHYLHKILAEYTIQKEQAIRTEHAEDYGKNEESDNCTKETLFYRDDD
jgi:hypothetical protein